MGLRLAPDLSFCVVEDHPIFLNRRADRYFQLGDPARAAFRTLLSGTPACPEGVSALLRQGVVVDGPSDGGSISPVLARVATSSGLEQVAGKTRGEALSAPGVWFCALRTAVRLKDTQFDANLRRSAQRRARRLEGGLADAIAQAATFERLRIALPQRRSCLRDSLALLDFLAAKGTRADLIVGVQARPFRAHCWVQRDDWALNETVHTARAFTPILVA